MTTYTMQHSQTVEMTDEEEFHAVLKELNDVSYKIFKTKVYRDTSLFPDLNRYELREMVGLINTLVDRHAPSIPTEAGLKARVARERFRNREKLSI